jgi:hypothetical protein
MSLISGTQTKYNINGEREDLADVIYNISPTDTPFLSSIGKGGKAKGVLHEWQTDSLADVDTGNAHLEGDEAAFTTPSATVRVGNYTQIMRKTAIVSGTVEEIDKAGRKSEMAYQLAKRAKELKRDQEAIMLSNQGGDAGGEGTARKMASMGAWLKTNVDFGTGGANPTYTAGVPDAARTDATSGDLRAFTETILKSVIEQVWTSGGDAKVLMVGPFNKQAVSTFPGIATRNFDLSNVSPRATAIIASVDVYVGDLGTLRVIPNRFQRERDAWVLDFSLISMPALRSYRSVPLAKTGDAEKRLLLVEHTLRVNQEAGLGLAADLTTT